MSLNELERWLLLQLLRDPKRDGDDTAVNLTAAVLDALDAAGWDRTSRRAMAHAKTVLRARLAPAEPTAKELLETGNFAMAELVNELDPDEEPREFTFSKAELDYLATMLRAAKDYRLGAARSWKRIRDRVETAVKTP